MELPPALHDDRIRFCPVSLTDWLGVATDADVLHVPGHVVATFESEHLRLCNHAGPHRAAMAHAIRRVNAERRFGGMLRWEACADLRIKCALADGVRPGRTVRETARATAGEADLQMDLRLSQVLEEWPRSTMHVLSRPWVEARIADHWPVEYRVFVEDGRIEGISSYYPQRPLRRDDRELEAVRRAAVQLTAGLTAMRRRAGPRHRGWLWTTTGSASLTTAGMLTLTGTPAAHDIDGMHATLDFLIDPEGRAWFLEGGPPWWMGAHPCCFEHDVTDGHGIDGIALVHPDHPTAAAPHGER